MAVNPTGINAETASRDEWGIGIGHIDVWSATRNLRELVVVSVLAVILPPHGNHRRQGVTSTTILQTPGTARSAHQVFHGPDLGSDKAAVGAAV